MRKTAVLSHIVIDEVHPAEGEAHTEVGGAGAYAAVGAALAGEPGSSLLVSGTGSADLPELAAWCEERGIDPSGLFVVGRHGPRTRIDYRPDGEREETPVHGLDHFDAHTPLPGHIPAGTDLAALYLFHAAEEDYWERIARHRAASAVPALWELSALAAVPELLPAVREHAALVDAISLNRTEALRLFEAGGVADAIAALREFGTLAVLRLGEEGSVVIEGARVTRVPAAPVRVADPTGGGNSYSGAFIAALAASGDPVRAACVAAAAAGVVIAGRGAPAVTAATRERVARQAEELRPAAL